MEYWDTFFCCAINRYASKQHGFVKLSAVTSIKRMFYVIGSFHKWPNLRFYPTFTGIFPIFACHSFGPVSCTDVPFTSTATVTGISCTVNS